MEKDKEKSKRAKWLPYVFGVGLILFMVHSPDQPLKEYAFLPHIGLGIIIGCVIASIYPFKEIDLGPRWIWIPMLVIVASIGIVAIVNPSQFNFAGVIMGLLLFGVYLASRKIGSDIFKVFTVVVVIEAVSCVVLGLMEPGVRTGGIINYPTNNYDIATGVLVFGAVVSIFRHQWLVVSIALVGLVFTGSEEAIVAVVVLGIAVLVRRDLGWRLFVPVGLLVIIAIIGMATGIGYKVYETTSTKFKVLQSIWVNESFDMQDLPTRVGIDVPVSFPREFYLYGDEDYPIKYEAEWEEKLDFVSHWRWTQYKTAAKNFNWIGHGYDINKFTFYTVHNVPYIIVDQIGVVAAIAWLFVTGFCLVRYRWKYAWIAIIGLCLFDHYIWTQCAPWWWVLAGVSSSSTIKNDLIFKGEQ